MSRERKNSANPMVDDRTLREYWESSAEAKLNWLEDINRLNEKVLTPRKRAIRERLRQEKN